MINEITLKLKATLVFAKKYSWPLLSLSLPVSLSFYVLENILPGIFGSERVSLFFSIILTFIYNGIFYSLLIYLIDSLHRDKLVSRAELKRFIGANFSQIAAAIVLISFFSIGGLFLFIIPGIYLYSRLAITPYLLCLHENGFQKAFYNSYENSKPYTWVIFLTSLIISLPEVLVVYDQFFTQQFPPWIFTIFSYLTSILQTILIYHFYLDIKPRINVHVRENV